MNGISVKNLRKSYGEQLVLNDVTFELPNQGITCIMAPSGVGKTTLLRILLGLEDRHSSRVEAKNPALLWNRDGYLLELTGWTQGSQAS